MSFLVVQTKKLPQKSSFSVHFQWKFNQALKPKMLRKTQPSCRLNSRFNESDRCFSIIVRKASISFSLPQIENQKAHRNSKTIHQNAEMLKKTLHFPDKFSKYLFAFPTPEDFIYLPRNFRCCKQIGNESFPLLLAIVLCKLFFHLSLA